jgi:alpha-tubulin suppressor-like RCC1 family protein
MRRTIPILLSLSTIVATVLVGSPAQAATVVVTMPDPVLVGTTGLVQGPVLTEQASGDIGTGTVTFRLSAGYAWAFPGGEIPTVSVTDLTKCAKNTSLRLGPDLVQSMTLNPDGSDLTVTIRRASRRGCRGQLRFTGIQVHALHTGTGTVSYAGTATISGLPAGTVLAQVRTQPGPVATGWGVDSYGQVLPGGSSDTIPYPMQVENPAIPGTGLGAADETSYAIQPDGSVLGWGRYADGSNQSSTPVPVPGVTNATAVTGGFAHSLALRADGSVLAWGSQDHGQIGNGVIDSGYQLGFAPPTVVQGVTGAVVVEAAERTSYAVLADGRLLAWGDGEVGQLGNGTRQSSAVPVQVSGLTGVVGVSAFSYLVVAVTSDGSVWQWGWDGRTFGSDGSAAVDVVPRLVGGLPPASQVAVGDSHVLVLAGDGTVWAWGSNGDGRLGDGMTVSRSTPAQCVGLAGIVQVTATGSSSNAVGSDGTPYEWGPVSTRPGSPGNTLVPTPVWGIDHVRGIVAGASYLLAVVS